MAGCLEKRAVFLSVALPGLNQVLDSTKRHWTGYARKKKKLTSSIAFNVRSAFGLIGPDVLYTVPCGLKFTWYLSGWRKDPDNVVFGRKYILDGFVDGGVFTDDRVNNLACGFKDEFVYDLEGTVGVLVEIEPLRAYYSGVKHYYSERLGYLVLREDRTLGRDVLVYGLKPDLSFMPLASIVSCWKKFFDEYSRIRDTLNHFKKRIGDG